MGLWRHRGRVPHGAVGGLGIGERCRWIRIVSIGVGFYRNYQGQRGKCQRGRCPEFQEQRRNIGNQCGGICGKRRSNLRIHFGR